MPYCYFNYRYAPGSSGLLQNLGYPQLREMAVEDQLLGEQMTASDYSRFAVTLNGYDLKQSVIARLEYYKGTVSELDALKQLLFEQIQGTEPYRSNLYWRLLAVLNQNGLCGLGSWDLRKAFRNASLDLDIRVQKVAITNHYNDDERQGMLMYEPYLKIETVLEVFAFFHTGGEVMYFIDDNEPIFTTEIQYIISSHSIINEAGKGNYNPYMRVQEIQQWSDTDKALDISPIQIPSLYLHQEFVPEVFSRMKSIINELKDMYVSKGALGRVSEGAWSRAWKNTFGNRKLRSLKLELLNKAEAKLNIIRAKNYTGSHELWQACQEFKDQLLVDNKALYSNLEVKLPEGGGDFKIHLEQAFNSAMKELFNPVSKNGTTELTIPPIPVQWMEQRRGTCTVSAVPNLTV